MSEREFSWRRWFSRSKKSRERRFPALDLSLMKVVGDKKDFSCFRVAPEFGADETVAVIGFGPEDATFAEANLTVGHISTVLKTVETSASGRVTEGEDAPYQLFTANVNKGVSGAPVYDVATYEVVGVFTKLRQNYPEDQGQAAFTAVPTGTKAYARAPTIG